LVVSDIIQSVRNYGGDFVKLVVGNKKKNKKKEEETVVNSNDNNSNSNDSTYGTTTYYEPVSERMVREKVGQGLRDALHTQYKSSTGAKRRKRDARKAAYHDQISRIVSQQETVCTIVAAVASKVLQNQKDTTSSSSTPSIGGAILTTDEQYSELFQYANMRILKELKDSNCAAAMDDGSDDDGDI
jgi:hypothetical protein